MISLSSIVGLLAAASAPPGAEAADAPAWLPVLFLAVIAYPVMQVLIPQGLTGIRAIAAWAPAFVMVPAYLLVGLGLLLGMTGAPIWLWLLCPPACIYLLVVRLVWRPRPTS